MKVIETKQWVAVIVFSAYLFLGVFGLFPMQHTVSHHVPDCPYAQGAQSMCDNGIGHIRGWLQSGEVIPSTIYVPVLVSSILWFILPVVAIGYLLQTRWRRREVWRSLYQILFAKGILNPKLY